MYPATRTCRRLHLSLRGLLPLLLNRPEFKRLRESVAAGGHAPLLHGIGEAARPYLVAGLAATQRSPVLYVVHDGEQVARTVDSLTRVLGDEVPVLPFPDRDALLFERLIPDAESVQARMRALTLLSRIGARCVV